MKNKIHPDALNAAIDEKFSIPISEDAAENIKDKLLPKVICIDDNKTFFRKIDPLIKLTNQEKENQTKGKRKKKPNKSVKLSGR